MSEIDKTVEFSNAEVSDIRNLTLKQAKNVETTGNTFMWILVVCGFITILASVLVGVASFANIVLILLGFFTGVGLIILGVFIREIVFRSVHCLLLCQQMNLKMQEDALDKQDKEVP